MDDGRAVDVAGSAQPAPHDAAVPPGSWTGDRFMDGCVVLSMRLKSIVDRVGKAATWLLVPLVAVTMWDVFARKLVWIQIFMVENFGSMFESTLLQEMEWHLHTALFTLVLGYGYTHNRHVRVDFLRENMKFRTQAWIEFIGCTLFLIPYVSIIIYFACIYAYDSFLIGEQSASLVGLSHRWIIKSVLIIGMIFALLAGFAVWLQCFVVLFGKPQHRFALMTLRWPESVDREIDRVRLWVRLKKRAGLLNPRRRRGG